MRQRKQTKQPEYILIGMTHDDRLVHLLTSTDSKLLLKMIDNTSQDVTRAKFFRELTIALKMETIRYTESGHVR